MALKTAPGINWLLHFVPSQLEFQSQHRACYRPEFSCSVSLIEHTVKLRPKEERRLTRVREG